MTAAGVALLVGGLATLISFRSVLFGSGGRDDVLQESADPPSGEHWTPVPVDLAPDPEPSAKGYGWPRRVDLLSPVSPAEPPTGFEAEPTEVVLSWPPINDDRRAQSWSTRNVNSGGHPRAVFPGGPGERPTVMEKRRTVYVSRHAADPRS